MKRFYLKASALLFMFVSFWNEIKSAKNDNNEAGVNTTSNMPKQELDEVYLEFVEYDLNRDGLIDAEEIISVLKYMKKSDFINFFTKVDLDSSGTISLNEYMIFINSN
ncbi:centrin, putative [Plasmodium berghei]|uniref:non-specific serine/threonine protein kinase n=2 Tax=Plasmodium berghei TaxID=5821 RepID=A0A509AHV9_PLABA|nr:centrin, putative [Plasmodium berghei ANKA]CXI28744.1 centrin, putative [Plasmodium berghei]SCM20609.1 centrin, putative [Plasmodium berghei]SCN24219.1 centrin, putative [Plasmodium berghei]SCO59437.1 centrin, putative [Plasmodium berghei]SCO60674.1 centrin, putative [Plasmodium berghei]|eukprot:XP_034420976.1 centrin, putative [Plasmodium berghei ANKA]